LQRQDNQDKTIFTLFILPLQAIVPILFFMQPDVYACMSNCYARGTFAA
jgi:hypothetical protein